MQSNMQIYHLHIGSDGKQGHLNQSYLPARIILKILLMYVFSSPTPIPAKLLIMECEW